MADETTWSVEKFLSKLKNSLGISELDGTINLEPDIDSSSSFSFDTWFNGTEEHHYWNESVKNLWDSWIENIPSDPNAKPRDIKDIKNSDAGFDFSKEPYVKPDLNIDSQTYENVRGDDKIESVLKNKKQMQYTHTQNKTDGANTEKYIRLLMPKYLRRVEVEDLNRNFWVIAQTIGLISDYLLSPESPLNKLIEGILKEIAQLWDNIHRIWEALYALGEKVKNTDNRIDKIVEAVQKTKVKINLNIYPHYTNKGKEIRRMLGLNPDGNETVNITRIEWCPITVKNGEWISLSSDYDNYAAVLNGKIEEYKSYKRDAEKFDLKDETAGNFRTGCKIYFKIDNGVEQNVNYNFLEPYAFSNKDFYGMYYYGQRIDADQAYIHINKAIIDCLTKIDDYTYTHPSFVDSITNNDQTVGPITVERDGNNKKPLNQILSNIMGFNFVLKDIAKNSYKEQQICSWDLIPDKANEMFQKIDTTDYWKDLLGILSTFTTNGVQSYKDEKGENVSVIWTAPVVIASAVTNLPLGQMENINFSYTKALTFLEALRDRFIDNKDKKYIEIINTFNDFYKNQSNNNYKNFMDIFLDVLELSPQKLGFSSFLADTTNNWLDKYEEAVKTAVQSPNTMSYKIFNKDIIGGLLGTPIPWAFLECDHYKNEMKINFDNNYSQKVKSLLSGYDSTSSNANGGRIHWQIISSIVPEDTFRIAGGNKLIPSTNDFLKLESISNNYSNLAISNIEQSEGTPLINYLGSEKGDKYTQAFAAMGALKGMSFDSQNVRTTYIQPYLKHSLDNYWVVFSSADTTGGRIQFRINSSNIRSFSPPNSVLGALNGVSGAADCFPHNTSISVNYCSPFLDNGNFFKQTKIDSIIRFNSPENQLFGIDEPMATTWYDQYGFVDKTKCIIRWTKNEQFLIDGFLGTKTGVKWDKNVKRRGYEFNNVYKNGLEKPIDWYPTPTENTFEFCQGPPIWRYGSGVYGKIRPIKLFTPYGLVDSSGEYLSFSDITLQQLLGNDFFSNTKDGNTVNVSNLKLIFTVQMDFLSYGTGGSNNNLCVLSISKGERESSAQKNIADDTNKVSGINDFNEN